MHNTLMAQDSSTAEQLAPTSVAATAAAPLIFEQPLNERMRTFLRLDYLYNQALYHNEKASQWGSRAAVASLIDILAITTRSDVRSEVLKRIWAAFREHGIEIPFAQRDINLRDNPQFRRLVEALAHRESPAEG